jgi:exopolyphosphatase/guanosine-5'-triphosphate,3'-diphosphate pyrophosphatase
MSSVRVAAIDCGTNSIRLLVADLPSGSGLLTEIDRRMEIVRLGKGVDRTGMLDPAAIVRTRMALQTYVSAIRELGATRIRMVATSATRDASNAADFRSMVLDTLGVSPEVITGDEEARLSFLGATRGLPSSAQPPYLVVDIGGGSTEFVLGGPAQNNSEQEQPATSAAHERSTVDAAVIVEHAVSVDIGCVRMTERHLADDPPGSEQIAAAEDDINAAVDRALAVVPGQQARTLVGLAGSVTTVAALALGLDRYDPRAIHHATIPAADVEAVTAQLLGMTHDQRLALAPMHPGRADVIGAGALVLRTILRRTGLPAVIASEQDILDGIAYSLG